jgi:hypothetical protein
VIGTSPWRSTCGWPNRFQWTDLNEPDPRISIRELFAFLAAAYLFMTSLGSILVRTGLVRRTVTVVADGEPWTQLETLEDAGPDARVFRVDPATGSIQFGDGAQGRVPPGWVIITSSYRYGRCRLTASVPASPPVTAVLPPRPRGVGSKEAQCGTGRPLPRWQAAATVNDPR